MVVSIRTNLASLSTLNQGKKVNEDIDRSAEKLSSGKRVVHAADDAAALSLSEKAKASIASTNQSVRNSNNAISFLQILEGNMSSISDMAIRMKELSIQSASDTLGDAEREMTNVEFRQLNNEINRILRISQGNGSLPSISGTRELLQSQLVDRAPKVLDFKVGGEVESANNIKYRPTSMKMSEVDFDLTNVHINTKSGAQHAITEMETVIGKVSEARSSLGALQTRIAHAATVGEVSAENASESNSRRLDLDYASETAKNVKEKIISQVNLSVQAQCNTSAQLLLKLL